MTEALLHYIWQHQMLDRGLTTTDGQPVVVLSAGELNHDAGPDFFNARLRIDGVEWVGSIEVHIHTSDWRAHHHSKDKAYNGIILHIVYEHDCEITTEDGRVPLTLELKPFMHPALVANYDALMSPSLAESIPCGRRLGEVPDFIFNSFVERLVLERIEEKSQTVRRLLDESHGGWEQTCYWLMAHYFGGRVNAVPFELMAKATDQRLLARWKDNPQRIEAVLMGQSGFLEGYFEDEYPRRLQSDYAALAAGAGLKPIDNYLWKFYCLRPSAFPTIRISQFARLVSESSNLFASMLEMTDVHDLENLFKQEAADYWRNHYQFDRPTEKSTAKRIGKMQAHLLIINAWVPLLFVYGIQHGQQQYKDQAFSLLSQLPPEDNAIIRRWQSYGISPTNAAESQALLQLGNNYCRNRRCLECRIGYHILKHK